MSQRDQIGAFEQAVLLVLVRLGETAYGMTIRRELERRTGREVAIGAVYATLDRMETKGFVASRYGEQTDVRGGRAKRFFRIEAPGRRALQQSLLAIDQLRAGLGSKLEPRRGEAMA